MWAVIISDILVLLEYHLFSLAMHRHPALADTILNLPWQRMPWGRSPAQFLG